MSERKSNKSHRAAGATRPASPMDVQLLQRLVDLMAANDLNTVDVRDGDQRIKLKRAAAMGITATAAPAMPSAASGSAASPPTGHVEEPVLISIKSPMVGTYYQSPAKAAKPFVSVGTVVDEETDVCIVEAMKVFNNIKAECRGTIAKVLVQDSQPVEFGQVLFLVKPS